VVDVPFTGFSPTLGRSSVAPDAVGSVQRYGITQQDHKRAQAFRRVGARMLKTLFTSLCGAEVGVNATNTRAQVQGVNSTFTINDNGGLRPVIVNTVINRATTQTDVNNINAVLTRARPQLAYEKTYGDATTAGSRGGNAVMLNGSGGLYRAGNELTADGFRVSEPFDAFMQPKATVPIADSTFILGESHLVRKP
jgi:hypothetical protein